MTTYIAGNSMSMKVSPNDGQPWSALIKGNKLWGGGHGYLYTVLGAMMQLKEITLSPTDKVIFCIGLNDCLYRKNLLNQIKRIHPIYQGSTGLIRAFLWGKIKLLLNKNPDELVQLLTFQEFTDFTNDLFSKYRGKGVVLGIHWVTRRNPKLCWGIKQLEEVNRILRIAAYENNLKFIDFWHPPNLRGKDGVHLTAAGHKIVADKITQVIK